MSTASHLEFDSNEIQAKGSGTTTADLFININGGKVFVGKSGLYFDDNGLNSNLIDGVNFTGKSDIIHYAVCDTEASTQIKLVSLSGFKLIKGAKAYVKFTKGNTHSTPYLNIESTGAKPIYQEVDSTVTNYSKIEENEIYELIYDGSNYVIVNSNKKIWQYTTSGSNWRSLLLSGQNNQNADAFDTNAFGAKYDTIYASSKILAKPYDGIIKAVTFQGNATSASKLTNTSIIGNTNQPVYFTASGVPQKINYTIDKSVPSNAVFTDTKVTSVSNHYAPSADSNKLLSVDASSSTSATWGSTSLVTGVNIQRDAAGHVTELTLDSIRMPAQPSSGDTVKVTAANNTDVYTYLVGVKSTDWTSTASGTNKQSALYIPANTDNGKGPRVKLSDGTLWGAVWNDYAECRETTDIEPGRVVCETGKGNLVLSTERLQGGANVVSDTFGFIIGETDKAKTPIAVSGRVLVYPLEDRETYAAGDAVCAGPNGTVSKMTREEIREYPDRILGTVSEIPEYDEWGQTGIKINGRIWIKIK